MFFCVEFFVWFVILYIVNIKERLVRFGILNNNEARCIFCKEELELMNYVFFYCKYVNFLWNSCLEWWRIFFVLLENIKELF